MAWVIFNKETLIEYMNSGLNTDYDPSLEELDLDEDEYEKIYYDDNDELAEDIEKYGALIFQDPETGNYNIEPNYPIPVKKRFIRIITTAPDVNPENNRFEIPADGRSTADLYVQLMVESEGGSNEFIKDKDPIGDYVEIESEILKDIDQNFRKREFRLKYTRVIEGSVKVYLNDIEIPSDEYRLNYDEGILYLNFYVEGTQKLTIDYETKRKKIRLKTTGGYLSDRWVITDDNGGAHFTLRSSQDTIDVDVSATTDGYGATEIYMEFIPV